MVKFSLLLAICVLSTLTVHMSASTAEFRSEGSTIPEKPDSATDSKSREKTSRPIAPGIVLYVISDSPIYARGDTIRIKLSAASRHVKAHAIFPFNSAPTRADAMYNTSEGGIYIRYKIPDNTPPGVYNIAVYVEEIQNNAQEIHTVEIDIRP